MSKNSLIFKNLEENQKIWNSHKDSVISVPEGFELIGSTENCKIAALQNLEK